MSKFNKIYEYEYHLFGQVSEYGDIMKYAHMQLYICSFLCFTLSLIVLVSLCLCAAAECDSNNDVSVRPFAGSGV